MKDVEEPYLNLDPKLAAIVDTHEIPNNCSVLSSINPKLSSSFGYSNKIKRSRIKEITKVHSKN